MTPAFYAEQEDGGDWWVVRRWAERDRPAACRAAVLYMHGDAWPDGGKAAAEAIAAMWNAQGHPT